MAKRFLSTLCAGQEKRKFRDEMHTNKEEVIEEEVVAMGGGKRDESL